VTTTIIMVSSDSLFHTLPKELQTIIDEAFIATVHPNSTGFHKPSNKSSPPKASSSSGGGFLLEDNEPPGGFNGDALENIEREGPEDSNKILLGLIPAALQRLDLPPDDPDVLAVFRNAASGWTSSSLNSLGISHSTETYVDRDDWRSVCAVLLEGRAPELDNGKSLSNSPSSAQMDEEDDEDASMTDDYVDDKSPSHSDREQEDSDEDYREASVRNSRRRGNRTTGGKRFLSPPSRLSEKPGQPTSRQRQTCLSTFGLFFPEVPSLELSKQKIMVADIQRVAKLLGEKIKADEVRTYILHKTLDSLTVI
jgi:hypothetical protein